MNISAEERHGGAEDWKIFGENVKGKVLACERGKPWGSP